MSFHVIIPSRYNSTRLYGKALIDIVGKPMIQHVYERAVQSGAESVVIATDDTRIQQAAQQFGAAVCITSAEHQTGTERLAEAVKLLKYKKDDIIVNVQGDEPLIPPTVIQQVAQNLVQTSFKMATLCNLITSAAELFDPNLVKVIFDKFGSALYFSRAPIPWEAKKFPINTDELLQNNYYHHIGIYAYRVSFLQEYAQMPASSLAQIESLEQLRVLENGEKIHVALAKEKVPAGVDTEKDLHNVLKLMVDEF